MNLKTGLLHQYPYIDYKDYKTETFKLESTNSVDLIWNTKCSLSCKINNQKMVIPSNTIILLDQGHSFYCSSNTLSQVKVLRLNAEFFSPSLVFLCGFINTFSKKGFNSNTMLFFKNEQTPLIANMFIEIEQVLKEDSLIRIKKLKSTINNLLQSPLTEKFANDAKYVNGFSKILNSQFNIFHNVSDYALQLDLEPKNLLRLFQKQGLKNPSTIIKEKLLLEIKEMIVFTNKSIKEICFETGFYDPAYFSRFFKKHVGVTAQYFRKQYTNKLSTAEMEKSATF